MRGQVRKRKCKNCHDYFLPDHRNRAQQKFCAKPPCRKASKAESQRRWLQKPENQDHFKGAINVERVQEWRKSHPGYWRKTPDKETTLQGPLSGETVCEDPVKASLSEDALQDSLSTQTVEGRAVETSLAEGALQDVLSAQAPVLLGLIAQLTGSALQDDIATTTRRLRQLGDDILNHQFPQKGARHDLKTTPMSTTNPKTPGGVQLAGSPSGP